MQNWPAGFQQRIEEILGVGESEIFVELELSRVNEQEAKLLKNKIILMQKELRIVRKDANAKMMGIRADYSDRIKSVKAGLFSTLVGRAKTKKESKKQALRVERDQELQRYEFVKNIIDNIQLQFDKNKLQIDQIITEGNFED